MIVEILSQQSAGICQAVWIYPRVGVEQDARGFQTRCAQDHRLPVYLMRLTCQAIHEDHSTRLAFTIKPYLTHHRIRTQGEILRSRSPRQRHVNRIKHGATIAPSVAVMAAAKVAASAISQLLGQDSRWKLHHVAPKLFRAATQELLGAGKRKWF